MNKRVTIIVGVLVAAVVGIGITVGVMAAGDGDHETLASHMGGTNDGGYQAMMGAMGSMDREAMLQHMREVLGEDAYQRMLTHAQQSGTPMSGNADQVMHAMMAGMMQNMPAGSGTMPNMPLGSGTVPNMPTGSGTMLAPGSDQHHDTPAPATTPAP